jgi:acylphosphatase
MKEALILVTGKVQGVFFREFVHDTAESLGVVGRVSNEKDGSVRVVAQGYEAILKKFIAKVEEGNGRSDISFVQVLWQKELSETFTYFDIVTTTDDTK